MIHRLLFALPVLGLGACAGTPPPLDVATLPPTEETKDWDGWGKDENLAARVQGQPMSGDAIKARLTGRVLSGCYASGNAFSEILGNDGVVRAPQTGDPLAKYQIQGDKLCFAYPSQSQQCYTVSADPKGLYFYTAGGFDLVAATACPIPLDS
ncbi:MAG: hypothetical protein AAGH41_09615 [Pseudomonadota bacterium]